MIKTSRQLKALVRNLTKGDSLQAQIIMRNYVMERFLERISLSKYRNNFILKGGMLVSAMVGLDTRSTMDIDTTIKNMPLSVENAREMIEEIIAVPIDDGMTFSIKSVGEIMDEAEYTGVRVNLEATLETMRTPLKVAISTGDIITPREVLYTFKLMFEERTISILAYNLETVLAEKMETVIARGVANTRLRDYYDLYILQNEYTHAISMEQFKAAFLATCKKRNSIQLIAEGNKILKELLLYKRLEKGSFVWSRNESEVQELTGQQFRWLMEGLTISPKRKVQEISIPNIPHNPCAKGRNFTG